jgi:hypothetical protein
MFGSFTYKTKTLGEEITSPFALLARVTDGKITLSNFWSTPSALLVASARPAYGTSEALQLEATLASALSL